MKKRLIISSVISIFLVSVLLLGSTYSIFTSQEIDETANVYKTGNLNVTYSIKNVDNTNSVQITDPTPMTVEEADAVFPYRVTVTNSGNVPYEFDVILMDTTSSEENTIDYQYIMTKVGYLEPVSLNNCTNNIIKENVIVPAGEKVDIDIRLWLDSTLPNTEIGKSFYAKLKIEGLAVYNDNEYIDNSKLSLRYMNTGNERFCSYEDYYCSDTYRTYIKTVSFVNFIDTSNTAIKIDTNEKIMWDMSQEKDESVIAWFEENGEVDESGNKLYNLYIGSEDKIYPKSLYSYFYNMSNVESIYFDNFDTSFVTNMRDVFYGCSKLVNLDVTSFNTSNVTNMYGVFQGCTSLTNIDVGNFNTSNVTTMKHMFYNCNSLLNLDLSNFNTSNVTDMSYVFDSCSSLTELDVSSFDTSKVTDMRFMFSGCKNLINLDLSNFDTSNVTDMSYLFQNFEIENLDISNFNTSKVTEMFRMFKDCSIKHLNLGYFDTSNVTSMGEMFNGAKYITTTITIRNYNLTGYGNVFYNCAYTSNGAQIVVNYVGDDPTTTDVNESTEALVETMIATKNGATNNVIKGECVGDYCSV